MRNTHAILIALLPMVLSTAVAAAQAPLRPTGNDWPPVLAAWCLRDDILKSESYKTSLNSLAAHSPYTLLSTSLRISQPGEIANPLVRDRVGKVARYANSLGLRMAVEFDIRLARRVFQDRYPDELQEELVLKIVELPAQGEAQVTFAGKDLNDHMTGGMIPYECLNTRLVRVYALTRGTQGIDPATLRDVTKNARVAPDGRRKLTVIVPAGVGGCACVIAAHTYLAPDVFAPHLLSFQRELVRQCAGLPLAGVMKDEWGFPPDHTGNPAHDRYWYSPAMAKAYAEASHGRELVRDALLMFADEQGQDRQREAAINLYRKLCRQRNAAIEDDYYRIGKEVFGPASFVVTHATWTPYPGAQEFRKNGLDWWEATRDMGQSDESTPYPCRTSLAKRWGYPLWYNQYYAPKPDTYARELWSDALSGGRLNVHPLYPPLNRPSPDARLALLRQPFTIGMSRLRMLDFITRAPLDCPVAVVFGHACAMNWAGPSYNHVGLEVASALGAAGYPADLFPASLVGTSALRIDSEGYVCLGPQRYRAVVLYQPEFGDEDQLAFFSRAAGGRSSLFLVGDWTRDSAAHPLDGTARLGGKARRCGNDAACVETVTRFLEQSGVDRVTEWSAHLASWGHPGAHATPPTDGHSALIDGTYVRVAGSKAAAGDPIRETFRWRGRTVAVDAVGVVAIRFASDGKVAALAAGGLKSLATDGLQIELPERADLAFVADSGAKIRGVLQGLKGDMPPALLAITPDWQRLAVPPLLPE